MKIAGYECHAVADLFPLMEGAKLQALADDIKANGLHNAIMYQVVDGRRIILDGRNRLRACELAGVEPQFAEVDIFRGAAGPKSMDTVGAWIVSQNLHRRHLTASQRAMVAAALVPLFEEEARARIIAGGRAGGLGKGPANLPEASRGEAREKAAEAVNVSPRSVQDALTVMQKAPPEVVEAVKTGKTAVSAAAKPYAPRRPKADPKGSPATNWSMKTRRGGPTRRVPRTPELLAEFLVREWPSTDVDLLVRTLVRLRGTGPSTPQTGRRSPTDAEVLAAINEPAQMVDVAERLGASVKNIDATLHALRRRGAVRQVQLGSPPVEHWQRVQGGAP